MIKLSLRRAICQFMCLLILATGSMSAWAEEAIDASDPTRIYSFAGAGLKWSDYTNGEEMWEGRLVGNIGVTEQDMVMFELGYGKHSGNKVSGKNDGLTNARARWFHLFNMDYGVEQGYRGWATQVDLQLAGSLKGTDGQNTLSVGVLPAYGLNHNWSMFLPVSMVNTWDKEFKNYNGMGISLAPLLVYSPDNWWQGAFVQFWPNYVRFVSGDLKGEGSGNMDISLGGQITPKVFWGLTYQKNLDKDLKTLRRDRDAGLSNDQNVFFNITTYF